MLTVGRAALEAHDRDAARAAVAPLIASDSPHGRPTRRVCLLMADIEEAEGHLGAVREWLARAARAPRDKAWVADGVISDRWAPVSPSGTLDAFVWRTPDERLAPYIEPPPVEPEPPSTPPQIAAPIACACAPGSRGASLGPASRAAAPRVARAGAALAASSSTRLPWRRTIPAPANRRSSTVTSRSTPANEPRRSTGAPTGTILTMSSSSAVIVGAGHAGVQAAASLREDGFQEPIVLLSDEPELPYQRPPLSKAFLKGEMDIHGLPLRAESFFREHGIDLRRGVRATRIDRACEASGDERRERDRIRPSDPGDGRAAKASRRAGRRSARGHEPAHDRRRDRDPRKA